MCASNSATCELGRGEHPNFRNLPLPPLPLPPPPGRPKFNDLRCGNKRQSKPASSVAEPAREAPRPQQVAVARHWPNAKGHPSQTVDGRNIRTPADMSRPPFPPHFNVEPGQTWAWLLQGFDYFFHSPDLSPGSEQHCSRGEGGDKVLKGSNISSIYGPRGGRVCGRLTTAAGLCKIQVEAPVPTGASVLAK